MKNELTEKLRRLSDGLRGMCDGAGIKDQTCSDVLDAAAAELERLQKDVDRYATEAYAHVREKNALFDRLSHLLQSEVIRAYDEKHASTDSYIIDIKELDKHVRRLEEFEQGVRDAAADQEADVSVVYICDRKKCALCNSACMHTTDFRHALRVDGYGSLWIDAMGGGGACR